MPIPESRIIEINGVDLQYLNWGGDGATILFLAGMGCSAHIYDSFAPMFVPRFRALALSRRGHGASKANSEAYDIDSLASDILAFVETLCLRQVLLVGHSFACAELSRLCRRAPDRFLGVVLLDGAYDYRLLPDVSERDPLASFDHPDLEGFKSEEDFNNQVRKIRPDLDAIWPELSETYLRESITINRSGLIQERVRPETYERMHEILLAYEPEWADANIPILSIFSIWNVHGHALPEYLSLDQRQQVIDFIDDVKVPAQRQWIEDFRIAVPDAEVVVIENGHHYCFLTHKQEVANNMHRFFTGLA